MRIPVIAMILSASCAWAQPLPGDPQEGYRIAQAQCQECHHIERKWADLTAKPGPSFAKVANTSGINERSLSVFFQTPHKDMPNIILTSQQTDDIIAYILGLKTD